MSPVPTPTRVDMQWMRFRSLPALVAENLFLRKQLAFYREREIEPRRLTDAAVCIRISFAFEM
jgi:hypothetical protein